MELTPLGTGSPDGLPRPDCPCAICAACAATVACARETVDPASHGPRAATSLLIDGTLLLDLTPGPAFAAARAGRSLSGVRQVLLSHPHDGPALELPAGLPAPVRVPDGRELALISGHRVRAVALDSPGTGYEVTGPGGPRLLYLPPGAAPAGLNRPPATETWDGGPGLPAPAVRHETAGRESVREQSARHGPAPYDIVLLDVVGRPDALALLRETGACGADTDVVAVHIGHEVPQGAELQRRLAAAGARAVPDGTTLYACGHREHGGHGSHGSHGSHGGLHEQGHEPPAAPHHPLLPRRTLVLGGARSGKSAEAERRLHAFPGVEYVATGGTREGDREWAARVQLHRERRPASWRTRETCELVPLLAAEGPPLLIDCLSLWLTDAMDAVGAWDDTRWSDGGARRELATRVEELTAAVRNTPRTVVAVSNEAGSGVVPGTPAGRRFRDELGRLNAAFAAECEHVLLVTAGIATVLRG